MILSSHSHAHADRRSRLELGWEGRQQLARWLGIDIASGVTAAIKSLPAGRALSRNAADASRRRLIECSPRFLDTSRGTRRAAHSRPTNHRVEASDQSLHSAATQLLQQRSNIGQDRQELRPRCIGHGSEPLPEARQQHLDVSTLRLGLGNSSRQNGQGLSKSPVGISQAPKVPQRSAIERDFVEHHPVDNPRQAPEAGIVRARVAVQGEQQLVRLRLFATSS